MSSLERTMQQTLYYLKYLQFQLKVRNSEAIFVGPWMGEVGPELQYWIPFLQNLSARRFFADKRIIIISRGGVQSWYKRISLEYRDLLGHMSINEFNKIRKKAIIKNRGQKQIACTQEEKILVSSIAQSLGINRFIMFHPSFVWKTVIPWLQEKFSINKFLSFFTYRIFDSPTLTYKGYVDLLKLPAKYIVTYFYENQIFPNTRENKNFIKKVVFLLSQKYYVVNLAHSFSVDGHGQFEFPKGKKIFPAGKNFPLKDNLGLKSEIVRRAHAFIGTNGGFSVLPAFLGVPCFSFYSRYDKRYLEIHSQHEKITRKIYSQFKGTYMALSVEDFDKFLGLMDIK